MTTTQSIRRTRPAVPEYAVHIVPFGQRTPTYDAIVALPITVEAMHLDRALRTLITATAPRRLPAIMALRDLLAVGGIWMPLGEAKRTIDAMAARIESENA